MPCSVDNEPTAYAKSNVCVLFRMLPCEMQTLLPHIHVVVMLRNTCLRARSNPYVGASGKYVNRRRGLDSNLSLPGTKADQVSLGTATASSPGASTSTREQVMTHSFQPRSRPHSLSPCPQGESRPVVFRHRPRHAGISRGRAPLGVVLLPHALRIAVVPAVRVGVDDSFGYLRLGEEEPVPPLRGGPLQP